jgi:hypothetical protein
MKIKLQNVRLSFPSLFQKAVFNGEETKFEATFLIDKETQSDKIEEIQKAIAEKVKAELKGKKVPDDKLCLKDGDESDYDGYAGMMSLKASNNKRPLVIDRDKSILTEDDNRIYSGCYVNATIELWVQNNNYGKRVNASLEVVRFRKEGERFGAPKVDVNEVLPDLEDDDFDV